MGLVTVFMQTLRPPTSLLVYRSVTQLSKKANTLHDSDLDIFNIRVTDS